MFEFHIYFTFILEICSDPGTNYTSVCGEGATGCTGPYLKPHCQCDDENYFLPAADGRSCKPGNAIFLSSNQVAAPLRLNAFLMSQQILTCPESIIETLGKGVKYF